MGRDVGLSIVGHGLSLKGRGQEEKAGARLGGSMDLKSGEVLEYQRWLGSRLQGVERAEGRGYQW